MSSSVSYAIQTAIQGFLTAAEELSAIPAANILVKALPKADEVVDPLPCIRICPYGEDTPGFESFEGQADQVYRIEVVLIDSTEADFATEQPTWQLWKEAVRAAIQKTSDGELRDTLDAVPTVWDIRLVKAPTFDRSKLAANYSYQSVVFEFHSAE